MQEIWKPIPGYELRYAVSNYGRIRSLTREVFDSKRLYFRTVKGEISKQQNHSKGYLTVRLFNGNEYKTFYSHRIVADAFVPKIKNAPQINHINGNKKDNKPENLEWCNNQENTIHAFAHGLCGHAESVMCIDDGKTFRSSSEAGRYYSFNGKAISDCCNGGRKTTHGKKFKFAPCVAES